jgi:natural product biosynthesis luciferase-like monooxygenase protein
VTIPTCTNLVDLLLTRASEKPDHRLYSFLADDLTITAHVSLQMLDRRARAIAAFLQSASKPGDRTLLVFPFGPEFLYAFWGSIYAGRIPVPAHAPKPGRPSQTLNAIYRDSLPSIALTNQELLPRMNELLAEATAAAQLHCWSVDEIPQESAAAWLRPEVGSSSIAFLQYTSGSTSTPKGVIVSHANIIENERMIQDAFGEDESSIVVSWLPLFHDMGLIGAVLQPLWCGGRCYLLSPQSFIQNPSRWLEAISRFKATTSGGPDFAYRLCSSRIGSEQLGNLDLSTWRVAFNGSEPVQAKTIRAFSERFASCGFRESAFVPCYGLAESTLLVTAKRSAGAISVATFQARELEKNRVVASSPDESGSRTLVGCGTGDAHQNIEIVIPESGVPCGTGEIGEIWISGPHVSQGYWNRQKETEDIFGAQALGKTNRYLRTGDLGFTLNGQLFITGRSRDLIIVRGRNFYPQDFEALVSEVHEAFRYGLGAAFSVNTDSEADLILVHETQSKSVDFVWACHAIREAIVNEYEISPTKIAFVRFGTLPKTSSGKVRRRECKARFLADELNVVFEEADQLRPASKAGVATDVKAQTGSTSLNPFREELFSIVSRALRRDAKSIDPEASLLSLGLDSLAAAELKAGVEKAFQVNIDLERILQGSSLAQLALLVVQSQITTERAVQPSLSVISSTYPLSHGQSAIWYLSRVFPQSTAYNISVAMECGAELKPDILEPALRLLIRRHPSLRTVFRSGDAGPYQQVLSESRPFFTSEDASHLSESALHQALEDEAARPFALEEGPLLRVSVFRTATGNNVLLFVVHHIIADFLSLEIVLQELGDVYTALSNNQQHIFASEPSRFSDYVSWQQKMLSSERGDELRKFWHERLQGELPLTELPAVKIRPSMQGFHGDSHPFRLSSITSRLLSERACELGVSIHSVLLAGFEILLHRYTWQSEIVVGTPVGGRLSSQWEQAVGLFINQIVLRTEISGDTRLSEFTRQIHREMAAALAHQEYPFPLLVEELQPKRDPSHSPLFQTMFSFYRAYRPEHRGLEAFLLGIPGAELQVGELKLHSMRLRNRTAQLDLTMSLAEIGGEFCGNLQWNVDLFDAESMQALATHYSTIMEAFATTPEQRIADIDLVKPEDRSLILSSSDPIFSDPMLEVVKSECVPSLFMEQVAAHPSSPAVVAGRESLTYADLAAKVINLAAYLRSEGIGADVPAAIFCSRSANLLIGILGTLFAGGAFVPVDPSLPSERAANMIAQSHALLVLTEGQLLSKLPKSDAKSILLEGKSPGVTSSDWNFDIAQENLAYILFTSGSTGKPKGVMLSHGNLTSFCKAMNEQIASGPGDTFFATTSISFDISILELLWPLTRGAQVTILPEQLRFAGAARHHNRTPSNLDFSLFYFSSSDSAGDSDKYKLMIEGSKYADRHGFQAVWTPERHFHEFGGLFPNPSVTSATIAAITERIAIRAGSVVLPLHDPIRVAEEWAVVDNLSNGRIGIAFASGWHADDFAFFPERYERRKEFMYRDLQTLQRLWRGESISVQSGSGKPIEVRIYPKPIQPTLPIWITTGGTSDTFQKAGEIGANILTHLLGQNIEKVAANIGAYRESRARNGHDPDAGIVTLMLHTFLGESIQSVREQVRTPFKNYLRTSVDLIGNLIRSAGLNLNLNEMSPRDFDDLLSFAFDRYFDSSGLFGTVKSCRELISNLQEIGVNEIGCLIDFGVETNAALASLNEVTALMEQLGSHVTAPTTPLVGPGRRILQCTPSMARLLFDDSSNREFLIGLDILLLGGEGLAAEVVEKVKSIAPNCKLMNMYGPTETTIWSTTHPVTEFTGPVPIGKPLANNTVHILDNYGHPVSPGMHGEIYLGGDGVARGYVNSPAATAEKFVPDPFSQRPGRRMYRTGDMGSYRKDGVIDFHGRNDAQVKLRGYRIELSEVEATLVSHPGVQQCVVSVRTVENMKSLLAHVVSMEGRELRADELRGFLKVTLPDYMIPSQFIFIKEVPLTTSGKIDRQRLPEMEHHRPLLETRLILPRDKVEGEVVAIWKEVLRIPELGIDDNFFDLGGHSLLMAQAHRAIQDHFGITIPLIKLLEFPTIRTLASHLRGTPEKDAAAEFEPRASRQRMAALLQRQTAERVRLSS